jgi:hypothetical protein
LLAKPTLLNINLGSDRFSMFKKERDTPPVWSRKRAVFTAGRLPEMGQFRTSVGLWHDEPLHSSTAGGTIT